MSRPVIYISGPYTANSKELEQVNIDRAVAVGRRVREMGATALVPHIAIVQPEAKDPELIWNEAMLDCLALLSKCDAILMIDGWERSRGAKIELMQAEEWNLPVYFDEAALAVQMRRVA